MLNFEKFVLEAEEAKNTDAKVNPETEEEMEEFKKMVHEKR